MQPGGTGGGPSPTGLADVIETILDKGLVIDACIRVSLVGIEVLTIDARIVVASVDTYLRFAEAVSRLDISQEKEGLPGPSPSRDHAGMTARARPGARPGRPRRTCTRRALAGRRGWWSVSGLLLVVLSLPGPGTTR